jgi:meiotically up-regulated gene 157 (Mug157) protein
MGEQTFVATGDIDSMWTRDSAVQMGIYYGRMGRRYPYLRLIVQGAIRRQAFNIIQDPYANAYARKWRDPAKLSLKDRVIGRGGWVDTRNYELDSGAYFFTQLYDYYVAENVYRPDALLLEPLIFDAVMLMVDTWIVEQSHDTKSPYRYFELRNDGKGSPTSYTGMTWTGFRPSDDPARYGYLVPANIHAAAGLERILELNKRIWKSNELKTLASKLLDDIETGIQIYGIVDVYNPHTNTSERAYAYEVDGKGNALVDFDDANVPSLLSIPLLGWSKYNGDIYRNTRARLLSPINKYYFDGPVLRGIGSPHTPNNYVWPLALAIEALTEEGPNEHIAQVFTFQIRQLLKSACNDAMHEGVSSTTGCPVFSRPWFEWANALFVVLIETALGERCDISGRLAAQVEAAANANAKEQSTPIENNNMDFPGKPEQKLAQILSRHSSNFYQNKYRNDPKLPAFFQGIESAVKHVNHF